MKTNTLTLTAMVSGLVTLPQVCLATDFRVMAWPGYVSDSAILEFEKRYQVNVELSVIQTDDQMWTQINAPKGKAYDVFSLNTAELQRYIDNNKVQTIDTVLIPNHKNQQAPFDELHSIQGLSRNSQLYAVPYTYSEMGLIYNTDEFSKPPDSWNILWDPNYRGRVLAYEGSVHNFTLAGLSIGIRDPFNQSNEQLISSSKRLIELRRNVRTFYSSPAQSLDYLINEKIVLAFANYGSQQLNDLHKHQLEMAYTIPKEGALAWLDTWAISQSSPSRLLAHQWINFMLSTEVSEQLTREQGLANTINPNKQYFKNDNIHWLQPVENPQLRSELWQQIQQGVSEVSFNP
ncbi:extracellular solute-binding protein [Alginatibacterium sediminis]|uniref:Extracellular solute-binding protein n=1 Tax=Alginatibacterium sediminis TaxID=2164068 RepID=A0A420ED47_9ALTE|nr:extracellular solute-binding protein [Alginatibacterium sediminis]RKF18659.1 extracellular solute-binding protein [Alginatibacterium sediminis]